MPGERYSTASSAMTTLTVTPPTAHTTSEDGSPTIYGASDAVASVRFAVTTAANTQGQVHRLQATPTPMLKPTRWLCWSRPPPCSPVALIFQLSRSAPMSNARAGSAPSAAAPAIFAATSSVGAASLSLLNPAGGTNRR